MSINKSNIREEIKLELKLVKPTQDMKSAYLDFIYEWERFGEHITPYASRLLQSDYEQWLEVTNKLETNAPSHLVLAHTYFLIKDNNIILGSINIRHYLSDYLMQFGGHIGYGIRPTYRRKGFAVKMLAMALPMAKELGIQKVLITCDKNNIGSAKTIQKNGGVLEDEVADGYKIIQRYWIEV